MNNFHTIFDRANQRVGFAPFSCPTPLPGWVPGAWSACQSIGSSQCVSTRVIACVDASNNSTLPANFCPASPKPDNTQLCDCGAAAVPRAQQLSLTIAASLLAALLAMRAIKH